MSSFDSNGNYNKTEWKDDDLITADKLNKIEDAIQTVNKNDIERHKEADGRLDKLEQNEKVIEEELNNKATKEHTHDEYLTEHQDISNLATKEELNQGKTDMEAMVAEVEADLEGLHAKTDFVYPEMFGAIGDGANDDTEAFNQMFNTNKKIRFIKDATYRVGNISIPSNTDMKSDYNTTLNIFQNVTSNPVLLGVRDNCKIENIKFICAVESLEWNRCDITNKENVLLKNCLFEGFRHISDRPNAWGIYLENSKNIEIKNCEFNNNSQSDITILDGCENIIIDNCKGNALHINFEPNGSATLKNVHISNCNIDRLNTLENSFTKVLIDGILISNCTINKYFYRGGNITLNNVKINSYGEENTYYMGTFDGGSSLLLSKNLLSDSKLMGIGNSSSEPKPWYVGYSSTSNNIAREFDDFGECLVMNPEFKNTMIRIHTSIDVIPGETYCFKLAASSIYGEGASWLANHGWIRILDNEGNELSSKKIILNPATAGTTVQPSEKTTFIPIPENGAKIDIRLSNTETNSTSKTQFRVYNVGIYRVLNGQGISFDNSDKIYVESKPSLINVGGSKNVYLVGQTVYLKEPVAGGYLGYICTESGNPGVWKGFGLIES